MKSAEIKFVVDECTGPKVAAWLGSQGYDVFSVFHQIRGSSDIKILEKANLEKRVIITNDKDFGELIFKNGLPHKGVVFLRLDDERAANKIFCLDKLFTSQIVHLQNNFTVVTENSVRIIRQP